MHDLQEKIDRKEFLLSIGIKGSALLAAFCLGNCSYNKIDPRQDVQINQDLNTLTGNNTNTTSTGENLATTSGINTQTTSGLNTQTTSGVNTQTSTGTNTNQTYVTDFNVDIASNLNKIGDYFIDNFVLVVRVTSGNSANNFIAISQECAHQGIKQVFYNGSGFRCSVHGALYDLSGNCTNGITSGKLQFFNVEINGTNVRVFG